MLAANTWRASRTARLFLLILVLLLPSPSRAAEFVSLSGSVRDILGNVLADVEVLFVVASGKTSTPAALVHTDRAGRFVVDRILPGRYRVAAVKTGYITFVGNVDTLLQESVKLVLHPALDVDPQSVPPDASWSLRLPRRGILREVDSGLPDTGPTQPFAGPEPQRGADVTVQVEQLFSVGTANAEPGAETTGLRPSETRMEVASALGERGQIAVRGRRERIGTAPSEEATTAAERGSAVSVDLSYETGSAARLDINAFVNHADYSLSNAAPGSPSTLKQEQRSWGYDAAWTRQLDAISRVAVEVGYQDISMMQPSTGPETTPPVGSPVQGNLLSNQAMQARGFYERQAGERHVVQVLLQAQHMQFPATTLSTTAISSSGLEDSLSRWSIRADAQDTWNISVPFSLVYGLGYKHALTSQDANLIIPRVGGLLSAGRWFLRGMVSYHTVAGGDRNGLQGELAAFRPETPIGYEAELEVPLVRDVHLTSTVRYAPVQIDPMAFVSGTLAAFEHPLYLTDGNTAVSEQRLALVEERGGCSTYLEVTFGEAEGMVAPLLPFGTPFRMAPGVNLWYRTGRFGLRIPARGTDLQLEYRRVGAQGRTDLDEATGSEQESVELRVRQDIPAFQIPGDWRLLVALRLGSVESGDLEKWDPYGGKESVQALRQRFSAGVSVVF